MNTALDKACFVMGLREQQVPAWIFPIGSEFQFYRAIELAETFYMLLSEEGYNSIREAIYWAHFSKFDGDPSASSESLEILLESIYALQDVNPTMAREIIDDLTLIKLNGFVSLLNFLCKVRAFHTRPKSEQETLAALN